MFFQAPQPPQVALEVVQPSNKALPKELMAAIDAVHEAGAKWCRFVPQVKQVIAAQPTESYDAKMVSTGPAALFKNIQSFLLCH